MTEEWKIEQEHDMDISPVLRLVIEKRHLQYRKEKWIHQA